MNRPTVLVLVLLALGGAYAFVTRGERPAAPVNTLDNIHRTVLANAVAQYGIAKRNGSKVDACAAANAVKAAALQAQDEASFAQWSKVAKEECPTF